MNTTLRSACALVLILFLTIFTGGAAPAQPAQSAPALADTFAAVVPHRPIEEITRDREHAGLLLTQAKQRLSRADEGISGLEAMISAREKDLDALKTYVKNLDSDSSANEIALMKEKTALLEKVLDLVELRKKVLEGEASSARASIAFAESQEDLYSFEEKLARKRDERTALDKEKGSAADAAAMDLTIREMQEKVMDRWKTMLGKQDDSVSEEKDYLKLLRDLAEAQDAFRAR